MRLAPCLALVLVLAPALLASAQQQPYSGEGALPCLQCHQNEQIMGIRDTPHARFDDPRSPAGQAQCESCHGPSATHMEFPMQVGNIVFTKHGLTPISERNAACLTCHADEHTSWSTSMHAERVSCASCHKIHRPEDPALLRQNAPHECGTCHTDVLTGAPSNSPHPLQGDGAVYCTQCHDPHGPLDLVQACGSCHAQDAATLAAQPPQARSYHERALVASIPCTSCHKGFVHEMPEISLEAPRPVHSSRLSP